MFDSSTTARASILPDRGRSATDPLEKRRDIRRVTGGGRGYSAAFIAYTARRVLELACGTCGECEAKCRISCQSAIDTIAARFRMEPTKIRALAGRTATGGRRWFRRADGWYGYIHRGPYNTRACAARLAEFQAWETAQSDGLELQHLASVIAAVPALADAAIEREREQAMLMHRTATELAATAAAMLAAAEQKLRSLSERTRGAA